MKKIKKKSHATIKPKLLKPRKRNTNAQNSRVRWSQKSKLSLCEKVERLEEKNRLLVIERDDAVEMVKALRATVQSIKRHEAGVSLSDEFNLKIKDEEIERLKVEVVKLRFEIKHLTEQNETEKIDCDNRVPEPKPERTEEAMSAYNDALDKVANDCGVELSGRDNHPVSQTQYLANLVRQLESRVDGLDKRQYQTTQNIRRIDRDVAILEKDLKRAIPQ